MSPDPNPFPRWLMALLTLAFLALLAGGAWFYHLQQRAMHQEAEHTLTAIAQLKADQIAGWYQDQLADAALKIHPFLVPSISRFLYAPTEAHRQDLATRFDTIAAMHDYTDILLVDPDGTRRLGLNGGRYRHRGYAAALAAALREGKPVFVDLHREAPDGPAHVSVVAPLFEAAGTGRRALGALILITDASRFLYPLIASWPMPSQSAETFLVRRDGDHALYLNDLRHHPKAALSLRIPLTRTDAPGVKAVMGGSGFVLGRDYRGADVAAVILPIPAAHWCMVAKVDAEEAFGDWRLHAALLLALIVGAMSLVGAIGLVFWQRARKLHFRSLYRSEAALRESEGKWRNILTQTPQVGIALDARAGIVFANAHFLKMTGWREEEVIGRNWFDLFIPEDGREAVRAVFLAVMQSRGNHGYSTYENEILTRAGERRNVVWSNVTTTDAAGAVVEVTCLGIDVTERKRAEEMLAASEKRFMDVLYASSDAILLIGDNTFVDCNAATARMLGYATREAFLLSHPSALSPPVQPDGRGSFEKAEEMMRLAFEQGFHRFEWVHRRADGEDFPVEVSLTPIVHEGRRLLYCVWRDITRIKQAQEDLRTSEEKYRVLFNAFPLGITISDPDGGIVESNATASALLGLSLDEHVTRRIDGPQWRIIRPDGAPMAADEFASVRALRENRTVGNVEMGIVKPDGDITWINVTAAPLHLENYGVVVTYGDITARKRAERDYQTLFREMLDGFALHEIVCDEGGRPVDYRFLAVNPAFERMTDLRAEAIVGKTVLEIMPETEAYWIETYGRVAMTGEPAVFENTSGALGKRFQVTAFRPAPGQFACIFADVTARRRAEAERVRLMSAIEHTTEGIVITDIEGTIQYVNSAFERITGFSEAEAIGQTPRLLKSGEQDEAFYRRLWQTVLSGNTWQGRMTNRRKDGSLYVEEAAISPVRDPEGRVVHFVAVSRDVTTEIRMEEKLLQAQKMEAIGTLAGGIAHDFNNILFPIIGLSELLLEDLPEGSPERDNVMEIMTAGRRGSDLVKQILAFSRQDEGKKTPVRVQQVLKEVITLARATIPANIVISQRIQPDCGLVMADPTQVHQIAMNLVTNAYHAVEPTGGSIAIDLAEAAVSEADVSEADVSAPPIAAGRYARLTVSDTGCGIDPVVMEKIFEPYFTTKPQGKGTGLGLSIVYGIVRQLGGDVTVSSAVGSGTCVTVFLPLMGKRAAADAALPQARLETGSERILLVDDEAVIVQLERQMLERLGYRVSFRVSSLEALEAFRASPGAFDLVISDMTMPVMTGDRLALAMIAIRPDIPVIICTGFSERMDPEKAAAMGIRGFLMKPVVRADMARMVRAVLDGKTAPASA